MGDDELPPVAFLPPPNDYHDEPPLLYDVDDNAAEEAEDDDEDEGPPPSLVPYDSTVAFGFFPSPEEPVIRTIGDRNIGRTIGEAHVISPASNRAAVGGHQQAIDEHTLRMDPVSRHHGRTATGSRPAREHQPALRRRLVRITSLQLLRVQTAAAFRYLSQPGVPDVVLTLEVEGNTYFDSITRQIELACCWSNENGEVRLWVVCHPGGE